MIPGPDVDTEELGRMAIATRRTTYQVVGDFLAHVDVTFDDALRVVVDEWTEILTNCDLVSVRLIVATGHAVVSIRRGNGASWQEVDAPVGTDVTFSAGGPVRKVGDLVRYGVRGTR